MKGNKMVEFLTAPSGFGKTTHIYNKIRDNLKNGKRVMLVVPDQEAVSAEAMCADVMEGIPSQELYVCSFSRLCNDVFRKYGGIVYNYADKTTGRLLVFLALRSVSAYLKEYENISFSDTAVISGIHSTIGEFKRCGITPEKLYKVCEELPEAKKRLKNKLSDIALIYDAYNSNLGSSVCDPADDMSKLCAVLEEKDYFSEFDSIYIDSFYYFSALQYKVIYHIFKSCPYTCVSLCIPSDKKDEISFTLSEVYNVFSNLLEIAERCNADISVETLCLGVRFLNDETKYLEYALRNEEKTPFDTAEHVKCVICKTPFDEAEYAASIINKRIKDGKRFKNFAVVVNSIDNWHGIIDVIFEKFNIPYFMSSRTDIMQKPFVKLIFAAFNIHMSDFYREDVISYIKTGLVGLSYEDCDLFETYVKKWGINGNRFYKDSWEMNPSGYGTKFSEESAVQLERINRIKDYIITPLYDFSKALSQDGLTCEKVLDCIYDLLIKIDVKKQLGELVSSSQDSAEISEIYQIWNLFFKAAGDIAEICKNVTVTPEEYRALLSMVLSEIDIGKIPTSQDQVIIGESGKIRINNSDDIFILGVNEGDFPSSAKNNTVFSFSDIRELQKCGVSFTDEETLLLRDTFDFYKTVTSCRENAYITSSVKDSSMASNKPSVLFYKVSSLFPTGTYTFDGITASDIATYSVGLDFIGRHEKKRQINTVKKILAQNPQTSFATEKYKSLGMLSKETVQKIYEGDLRLSQSRIDSFRKCKFGYYCNYVLGLQNDKRIDIESNDLGTYVHYLLQRLLEEYIKGRVRSDASHDELCELIDTFTSEFTAQYLHISLDEHGHGKIRSLFERMKKNTVKAAENILLELSSSEFKPARLELSISDNGEMPPVRIRLSDGSDAVLGGIADRVDTYTDEKNTYIKLIDYKSGKNSFSLENIEKCDGIQLFVYMISICTKGSKLFGENIKPAAAFYVTVSPEIKDSDAPIDAEDAEKYASDSIVRRGAVLNSEEVMAAVFGKDGKFMPKYASDKKISYIADEQFTETFEKLKCAVGELAEKMKKGYSEALPEKIGSYMPCEYCDYKMVCRYESKTVKDDE